MIYTFRAQDGSTIELDLPIGTAPAWGSPYEHNGVTFYRAIECGSAPKVAANVRSRSHQLPRYYGYGNTPALVKRLGRRPTPKEQLADARKNAAKAGALDKFDGAGRPIALNMTQMHDHVARGRYMGDTIALD